MDTILNQLLIESNETKKFIEDLKTKQNDHTETMKNLTKVLEHFHIVIEKNKQDTDDLRDENKRLKKELMHSPNLRVRKIVKWREILGVTFRDLYTLNTDPDTHQLLISDVLHSILLPDTEFSDESEDTDVSNNNLKNKL